jgi:hypothetical protein
MHRIQGNTCGTRRRDVPCQGSLKPWIWRVATVPSLHVGDTQRNRTVGAVLARVPDRVDTQHGRKRAKRLWHVLQDLGTHSISVLWQQFAAMKVHTMHAKTSEKQAAVEAIHAKSPTTCKPMWTCYSVSEPGSHLCQRKASPLLPWNADIPAGLY